MFQEWVSFKELAFVEHMCKIGGIGKVANLLNSFFIYYKSFPLNYPNADFSEKELVFSIWLRK